MHYVALLYGDETEAAEPGTPEWDAELAGYDAFGEIAGDRTVGGEALQPASTARTVRRDPAGALTVTDGPYAEVVEALGGFYVLETGTEDEAIELARALPAATSGGVELRPMVMWDDRSAGQSALAGATRYLATIHGRDGDEHAPGTVEWDDGAAEHGRFAAEAGDALTACGALRKVDTARTVRVRAGEALVTDGPFAEGTEVVGGFYVLRSTDPDDAVALAARIPVGPGGAVELRPVMEF